MKNCKKKRKKRNIKQLTKGGVIGVVAGGCNSVEEVVVSENKL